MASNSGEIVSERKALEDGQTPVAVWLKHIKRAKDDAEDWIKHADEATIVYEADRSKEGGNIRFNILHSNIETIVPALYNSTPTPDVRRRFSDKDPVAKQGVDIIERCVSYTVDQYDLDATMREVVKDSELPGRGTARIRYEPKMEEQQDPEGQPFQAVGYQQVTCEHVQWNRWGHGPGKTWEQVQFVYFEHDLSAEDLEKLGVDPMRVEKLTFDEASSGSRRSEKKDSSGILKTVPTCEIWDKRRRKVWFVTEQDKDEPLLVIDDPLKLQNFYPIPKPLQPLRKRNSLMPIVPYQVYKPLVEELERITKRISSLINQLRVRGLYDKALGSDFELLKYCEDGQYEPAEQAAQFLSGGGLEKAIAHWPMEPTIAALQQLYVQRDQIKQTIYEVTGLSDILRGATDANETLGAQQIKAQWGSQRVQIKQAEVARFARDLFRMKAEIICNHFTSQNIQAMTQLEMPPEVEQVIRSDAMRGYRIDIESDSTIRADMTRTQEQMTMFLQSTAQFVQAMGAVVETMPQSMPAMVEVYTSFTRKFKLGKTAEDALESLSQISQQQAQAQQEAEQQEQPPSPEEQKMQMEMQVAQQKAQMDAQAMAAKAEADMRMKQADLEMMQQKSQIEIQFRAEELALKREEMALKREMMALDRAMKELEFKMKKESADIDLKAKRDGADIDLAKAKAMAEMPRGNGQAQKGLNG
jgi:hypothetical protein